MNIVGAKSSMIMKVGKVLLAGIMMLGVLSAMLVPVAYAEEKQHPDYIKEKWRTPFALYVDAKQAHAMKQEKGDEILLIDVRTRPELKYVGMAEGVDANIPVRTFNTEFAWSDKSSTFRTSVNDDFVAAVERLLAAKNKDRQTTLLLMCQSGSRVPIAARLLHKAGFTSVYTVWDGFEGAKAKDGDDKGKRVVNGWKNAGLPWSYKLDKEKMYFAPTAPDASDKASGD